MVNYLKPKILGFATQILKASVKIDLEKISCKIEPTKTKWFVCCMVIVATRRENWNFPFIFCFFIETFH